MNQKEEILENQEQKPKQENQVYTKADEELSVSALVGFMDDGGTYPQDDNEKKESIEKDSIEVVHNAVDKSLKSNTKDNNKDSQDDDLVEEGSAEDGNNEQTEDNHDNESKEVEQEETEEDNVSQENKNSTANNDEPIMEVDTVNMSKVNLKNIKDKNANQEEENQQKTIEDKRSNRTTAIDAFSKKYGIKADVINSKIDIYSKNLEDIVNLRNKDTTDEYIKNAILEKKRKDEDSASESLVRDMARTILNDIRNDSEIRVINKKDILKSQLQQEVKNTLIRTIEAIAIDNNNFRFDEVEKSRNNKYYISFLETFGVKEFNIDSNTFKKIFIKEDSFTAYLKLIEMFYVDEEERAKTRKLVEISKSIEFDIESVFEF